MFLLNYLCKVDIFDIKNKSLQYLKNIARLSTYFKQQRLLLKDLTNLTNLFFASKFCFFFSFIFAL